MRGKTERDCDSKEASAVERRKKQPPVAQVLFEAEGKEEAAIRLRETCRLLSESVNECVCLSVFEYECLGKE